MSLIPISSLLSSPTRAQFRATMVNELVTLGVPADKWIAGGVSSSILTVVSMSLELMAATLATIINGFFLQTATGNGLILLAYYMYGVVAPAATFATGAVIFVNGGGGVYSGPSYAAGQVLVLNPDTGITYETTQDLNLGAVGSLNASQTVNVRAMTAGTVGNSNPGAIDQLSTTLLGVTVSNADAVVGQDAIGDVALRTLCLNSLGARSVRGPRTAYAYAVQTATNSVTGALVNINRWSITNDSHFGTVGIVVASPAGAADPNDVSGVVANVEAVARPGGITANVSSASNVAIAQNLTVWATAPLGVSATALATAASTALTNYMATYPIGGILADDDASPGGITGIFADGMKGAIAAGIASAGGSMVACQGANDQALGSSNVPVNGCTVTVRLTTTTSP
jgi:hypothetical protein